MNKQRESVYTLRREILVGSIHLTEEEVVDSRGYFLALAEELLEDQVERFAGSQLEPEEQDFGALSREVSRVFGIDPAEIDRLEIADQSADRVTDALWALVKTSYEEKEKLLPQEILRRVERDVMLQIVDAQWKDHLYSLDHLKEGIGLRGYGQRDPLVEYKKESFTLFQDMKGRIEEEIVRYLCWLRPVSTTEARPAARRASPITMNKPAVSAPVFGAQSAQPAAAASIGGAGEPPRPARTGGDDVIKTFRREEPKVGRNDPCPCGSGKKYKKCHGGAAA
jgi:preprotein translocase subunit SecA